MKNITRNLLRSLATVLFTLSVGQAFAATTYYLSPSGSDSYDGKAPSYDGTHGPWQNLSRASSPMVAGDTLKFVAGTYSWSATQFFWRNGTDEARIKITNYDGPVVIDGSGATSSSASLFGIAADFLEISNLTVQNAKNCDIIMWGAHHDVKIENCICTGAGNSGISIGANNPNDSHDVQVNNCVIYNCCRTNSTLIVTPWTPALFVYHAQNVDITNTQIYQNYGEGLGFCTVEDCSASNNTVWDNFSVNIYLDNAVDTDILSNFVYTTYDSAYYRSGRAASGIQMAVEAVANPIGLHNCTISNNVVVNCFAGFWYGNYELGGGMQNCTVSNNSFYASQTSLLKIDTDAGHSGNAINNNIFYQVGSGGMTAGSASGFTMSSNNWYGGSSGSFSGTGDITSNPLFVNPGPNVLAGYALQSTSAALAAGIGSTYP